MEKLPLTSPPELMCEADEGEIGTSLSVPMALVSTKE